MSFSSWLGRPALRGGALLCGASWAFLLVACGDSGSVATTDDGGGAPLVVTQAQFAGFHSWTSFAFQGTPVPGSPHTSAGPRTDYIKAVPPAGATSFPVGTIIVKEVDDVADVTARQVFGMVKVGGGYNSQGARDWEWFELRNAADGTATILWNGSAPPAGEKYADTGVTCNACHAQAAANDYVQSHVLNLKAFGQGAATSADAGAPGSGGIVDAGATE